MWKNNFNLKKEYAETFNEKTCIEIQSQYWGQNRQLSMEVIACCLLFPKPN